MDDASGRRVKEFKSRIGFDESVQREASQEMVVHEWPPLTAAPALSDGTWSLASQSTYARPGGAETTSDLRAGDAELQVTLYVSSEGGAPAQNRLLELGSENMMPVVPYERARTPLGSLAIELVTAEEIDRIWWFRNMCFRVRGPRAGQTVDELSRWLQSLATGHLVDDVRPHLPPIRGVTATPEEIRVGQTAEILVDMPADAAADRYLFSAESTGGAVIVDREDGPKALVSGVRAEAGHVLVRVIDRRTLLTRAHTVVVRVTAP